MCTTEEMYDDNNVLLMYFRLRSWKEEEKEL